MASQAQAEMRNWSRGVYCAGRVRAELQRGGVGGWMAQGRAGWASLPSEMRLVSEPSVGASELLERRQRVGANKSGLDEASSRPEVHINEGAGKEEGPQGQTHSSSACPLSGGHC